MSPWPKGRAHTLQTKQKIKKAKKRQYQQHPITPETKQKISNAQKEYYQQHPKPPVTPETKQKIGQGVKEAAAKQTPEQRKQKVLQMSQTKIQYYQQHPKPPVTPETKLKISKAMRSYWAKLRQGLAQTFRERGIFTAIQPTRDKQGFEKIAAIKPTEKIPEKKLYAAMQKLTPLERQVIELKFGLHGEEKNFEQIAQMARTTTAHIIKICNNALRKLRKEIEKI